MTIFKNVFTCLNCCVFMDSTYPDHVCLLRNALYGLKQATRAWFHKVVFSLAKLRFVASQSNPSLFISHNSQDLTLVLVYVNDIIIMGSNNWLIYTLITSLSTWFSLKDLGSLHYFLDIQVTYNSQGLFLSQPKYVCDLLVRTKMDGTKPCNISTLHGQSLSKISSFTYDWSSHLPKHRGSSSICYHNTA